MMADNDMIYIVTRGIPRTFAELSDAETEAARLCERDHEDYTVTVIPRTSLEHGIVARYHGVVLHALDEVRKEDEER